MNSNDEYYIVHDPHEVNEASWNKFVIENGDGNVFQTPAMYRVFLSTDRYDPIFTAVLDDESNIVAVMLGVRIEEPGLLASRFSSRIIVYGGPLISGESKDPHLIETVLRAHNKEARKKAVFTEIRHLTKREYMSELSKPAGYHYIDHLNIHIDLTPGMDILWSHLHKNRKRGIRKALKSGLTSVLVSIDDIDELYGIITDTYERIRVPMPSKSLFESVITVLQEQNFARVVGIKLQETLVGIGVFLTFKDVIYLWYNSADRQHSALGVGEYTFWVAIEWAVGNGFKLFDFGGAGRSGHEYGVREFKQSMGGHQVELGRLICTHNKLKSFVAQVGYKVWRLAKRFA